MTTTRKYNCRDCGEEFQHDKPNRPPVRCAACREKQKPTGTTVPVKTKLNSIEMVDQLELHLRANNSHISQHRKDWE